MITHHTSLYNSDTTPAPRKVLKQELVTWEETPNGLRIARLTRTYAGPAHSDMFTSEHVLHRSLINTDGSAKSEPVDPSDG